jgi:isoquinoline 1-oxidoreductase subunit beta
MNSIASHPLSRRSIVAGLAVGGAAFVLGVPIAGAQQAKRDFGPGGPNEAFQYWLKVGADNTVTVSVHLAEMGQGITTALPQLVAEELGAAWADMRFEFPPNGKVYYNRGYGGFTEGTGGSASIRGQFTMFREIGATAREMFKSAAAAQWKVPAADLVIENTRVVHKASGRSATLSALSAVAAKQPVPTSITLKSKSEWALLGAPLPRLDTPQKTDGSAGYGTDVVVPGMLFAAIQQAPVYTAKLISVDDSPAMAVAGVQRVVSLPDAVVVVADSTWAAQKGLKALQPVWDAPPRAAYSSADLFKDFDAGLARTDLPVLKADGDVDAALKSPGQKITCDFTAPYLAHACMEPMNATAHVQADKTEIWIPGQGHTAVVDGVSKALGIAPGTIRVHRTFLGGGFGRRGEDDVAIQAALVSREMNRPVKLMWSREEDIRHDFYRPAAKMRITAVVDQKGQPTAFDMTNVCNSISKRRFPDAVKDGKDMSVLAGFNDSPYSIGNTRMRYALLDNGIPVGFWRAVHHTQNVFFREAMLNELAARVNADPIAFRRVLLADNPRYLAVLDDIEKLSDYATLLASAKPGTKRGRGFGLSNSHGSICAQVVDVTVGADNAIKIDRVSCVIDTGVIVNRGIVEAQMESSILDGLSSAMFGSMTPKDGGMAEGNFNEVRFMKLAETPELRVAVKDWPDTPPGGVGEPGVPPTPPALVDALAKATGVRLRALPVVKQGFNV